MPQAETPITVTVPAEKLSSVAFACSALRGSIAFVCDAAEDYGDPRLWAAAAALSKSLDTFEPLKKYA